jgi:molybdate transport system substrate-binding protein
MLHLLAISLVFICVSSSWSEELSLGVASNFAAPMQLIQSAFEAETGHDLRVSYGSSGSLYAQIVNGAPFDVFLAADQVTLNALQDAELLVYSSRFTYAVGGLALWSADEDLVSEDLDVLAEDEFDHIAVANPEVAPYGQAALDVIVVLGLAEQISSKLVTGENISQTYNFVATGSAELGFVALSQITRDGEITSGSYWVIPRDIYPPILQDAAILSRAAGKSVAEEFFDYLRSPEAAQIIRSYGYLLLASE